VVCGPDDVATTNWDVVATTDYEASWYYASVDPIPTTAFVTDAVGVEGAVVDALTGDSAASTAAGAVGVYFPNGCATATANGNVTTFVLNDCTGPLGLVGAPGTFTATFDVTDGGVQVQLAGSKIAANGGTINLATSGTLTSSNGQKTLQASTQTNGTGPDGNSAAHNGMYTLVWPTGDGCATINGTLTGVGSGLYSGTSTQITNYVTCTNKCPQSGTATSSFNGGSVTLTFDGSSNAQCSASNGTSASIPLRCQ